MGQHWDGNSDEEPHREPAPSPTAPEPVDSPEVRSRFWCPGCDEEVQVSPETIGELVRCPYCNTPFFASDEHSHLPVVDDTEDHPVNRDNELDTARVRRLSARRMSVVRVASWYLIGFLVSLWAIAAFAINAMREAFEDRRWGIWPTVSMAFVSGFVWLARWCRRELKLARIEIAGHGVSEPETAPDFTTLGDGHDRWKDLEHIR
jgi:hypothetical protein